VPRWPIPLELYQQQEFDRLIGNFFDRAICHTAEGYEHHASSVHRKKWPGDDLRIEPKSCWRHMESVLPNVLPQESNFEETSDVLIPLTKTATSAL